MAILEKEATDYLKRHGLTNDNGKGFYPDEDGVFHYWTDYNNYWSWWNNIPLSYDYVNSPLRQEGEAV